MSDQAGRIAELEGMLAEVGRHYDAACEGLVCAWHTEDKGAPGEPCGKCLTCAGERIARLETQIAMLRREVGLLEETIAEQAAVTQAAEKLSLELAECKARLKECEEGRSR